MFNKCKTRLMLIVTLGLLALPVMAANPPGPGTLNYLEGQVSMNGHPLASTEHARLDQNGILETSQGRAEMLLTPGVFLRIGDNSAVRMISPNLTDTQVRLLHGQAMVEVAQLFKENDIRVSIDGALTTLEKPGLYAFNADQPMVRVFDGKAAVISGDQRVELKKGHEVSLAGPLTAVKFDRKESQGPLYAWSNLRSEYEAQASMDTARTVVVGGPGWYGPGWYWDPWWSMYGFVPGAGIIYSPFGWPFYSPVVVYSAPFGYHRFYRGFAPRTGLGVARGPRMAPAFRSGGFARGPSMGRLSGGVRR